MKALIIHDSMTQPEDLAITMTHLMNAKITIRLVDVIDITSKDLKDIDWAVLDCWMPDDSLPIPVQNVLTNMSHEALQKLQLIELPDIERATWFYQEGKRYIAG